MLIVKIVIIGLNIELFLFWIIFNFIWFEFLRGLLSFWRDIFIYDKNEFVLYIIFFCLLIKYGLDVYKLYILCFC